MPTSSRVPRILRRLGLAGLAAASIVAPALAVGGCGGSTIDPVAQAATTSTSTPGFRMNFSLQFSSPALPTAFTGTGSGRFDVPDHSGALTLAMNLGSVPQVKQLLGSSTLQLNEVIKGLNVYLQFPPALAAKIPGGKSWMKIDLSQAAAAAGIPGLSSLSGSSLSSDPSQLLQFLHAVGNISNLGTETVGGVSTTHYRAVLMLDRLPNAVPPSLRKAAQQSAAALERVTHVRQLPVDAWIDGQHLVRRMRLTFSETLTSGTPLNAVIDLQIPQYGPQPPAVPPPASEVFDATSLVGSSVGSSASSGG